LDATTAFLRQSDAKGALTIVSEIPMHKIAIQVIAAALLTASSAAAQQQPAAPKAANPPPSTSPPANAPAAAKAAPTMERFTGVWVEGGGYNITYGGAYDACAAKCLATTKCVMIEYYRPEKKCNMYDAERPRLKGGASDVALKR
jgi:PAN domain